MPEGDSVWRTARDLHRALAGHQLVHSDFRVPRFATVDLSGRIVAAALARGKHLLIRVAGPAPVSIHTHLKMEGSWQLYPRGARWRRPAFQARVVLGTETTTAVGFALGLVEVLPTRHEQSVLGYLGPDLLGPDWDPAEAHRRLGSQPDIPIGTALLDQRNLAGIGNIYRNELCFLAGVHLQAPVWAAPDLARLIDTAHRLLDVNKDRASRTTTGAPGPQIRGPEVRVSAVRAARIGSTTGTADPAGAAAASSSTTDPAAAAGPGTSSSAAGPGISSSATSTFARTASRYPATASREMAENAGPAKP